MSNLVKLGKETIIYGLGNAINKFIAIFMVPILTRIFLPAQYGIIDLLSTTSSLITSLLVVGMDSAISFYFFSSKGKEQDEYVNTGFTFRLMISLLTTVILILFSNQISKVLFNSYTYNYIVFLSLCEIPFVVMKGFFIDLSRLLFKPWIYNILVIGHVIIQFVLTLVIVLYLNMSLVGVFYARLISSLLMFIITIIIFRNIIKFEIINKKLIQLLKYGLPLVPISIMYWVMNAADRYFLNGYTNLNQVGLYSLALKIATIMSLFVTAVQMAWGPFAFSIKDDCDAHKTYASALNIYLTASCILSLMIMCVSKLVIYYFSTSQYLDAASCVGFLTLSVVLNGAYYIVCIGLNLEKKTHYITYTSLIAAIMNIIFNFILVPTNGILGASFASMVGYLFSVLGVYFCSQKVHYIEYDIKYIKELIFTFTIFFVLLQCLSFENMWIEFLIKLGIFNIFIYIIIKLKLINIKKIKIILVKQLKK